MRHAYGTQARPDAPRACTQGTSASWVLCWLPARSLTHRHVRTPSDVRAACTRARASDHFCHILSHDALPYASGGGGRVV